jgi:hypothetical protein
MEKDPKSLQPKINHNIDEEFSRLIDEKITPWAFFNTGKMPQIMCNDLWGQYIT